MNILRQLKNDLFPIFQSFINTSHIEDMKLVASDAKKTGDYQINGFISRAELKNDPKKLKTVIDQFLTKLRESNFNWLQSASYAAPGFINLTLSNRSLFDAFKDNNGVEVKLNTVQPCVVIDYSAPNVAKEMAVHHMRSTFIGDALARILEHLNHRVIRVNHIGDWGTQFGLLLAWIKEKSLKVEEHSLLELEKIYAQAQEKKKEDPLFADAARSEVVALQRGDANSLEQWKKLVSISMERNYEIYRALNVSLSAKDTFGESFYNEQLPKVIDDLLSKKIAEYKDGMVIVFSEHFKQQNQEPMGIILQKSKGGFLYAATDLAAVRYRVEILHANRIIYCVDGRQSQHFQLVWEIARRAGYLPPHVSIEHHAFGMMLGQDGKPYKTRSGSTPKLMDLIIEASEQAKKIIVSRQLTHLSEKEQQNLTQALTINSIKYADLMRHRATNYKFSWEEALALEGNTAPYLMYALVRTHSILKKANGDKNKTFDFSQDQIELAFSNCDFVARILLIHLARWEEILEKAAIEGTPHLLCQYLYQLALKFSTFYEKEPVLSEKDLLQRVLKLKLIDRTAQVLSKGLDLLGLIAVDRM